VLRRTLAPAVCVVVLGACGSALTPPAAVVNGRDISQATLAESVREFLTDPATAQQVASEGAAGRPDFTRRVLRYLVQVELARGYARSRGIRVTAAEVQASLARDEQQQGGHRAFLRFLAGRGLTVDEVRGNIGRVILVTKVAQSLARAGTTAQTRTAQGAFDAWMRGRLRLADVRVNPRFGALDARTTEIVPITSTARLPG
jgi:SurA N-terminal domain